MESLLGVLTDLNQLIPILVHWLHLLSAVVWIGGLAFLVMAVTPCLKTTVPKDQVLNKGCSCFGCGLFPKYQLEKGYFCMPWEQK